MMKIGIFDSGLGGLLITKSLISTLPEYDYMYLGDTKRVPYGNRSQKVVYQFLEQGVRYLFEHGCVLVIVACNTASAEALRKIQKEFLPRYYSKRKVLGVIIPTAETVRDKNLKNVGVLATQGTVNSKAYIREIKKLDRSITVIQQAAPLLVPIIENHTTRFANPVLAEYLKPFKDAKVEGIILGCTHYPILKKPIRKILGKKIEIISQDEFIGGKLKEYFHRHPEVMRKLSRSEKKEIYLTDITKAYQNLCVEWFGKKASPKPVELGR